jgi:FAD/FMN-containing dehydrogenase
MSGSSTGYERLAAALAGEVVLPDDERFGEARLAWNTAVDTRPVAVAFPASADDMVATVRFAAAEGLRLAFIGGGHNAGPIDWGRDTLLVKTSKMTDIHLDVEGRRARVGAGTLAKPLAQAAGRHGLAYLAGTSPDVGVTGYTLGGGYNWMLRKHGFACNTVVSAEIVTAEGALIRVDRDSEPDLFWALRGGGGNFGAVTALELELFPYERVFGGALFWPIERATEVLHAWLEWVDGVPEECHSFGRMLQLPDLPFLPPHLNARSFVMVEAVFAGSEEDGRRLIAPLRALAPEFDTFEMMPMSELSLINMDPEMPLPYAGEGILLSGCTPPSVEALVDSFVGSPLVHVELRHLGGAAAVGSPDHGVLDCVPEPYLLFTFGLTPDTQSTEAVEHSVDRLLEGQAPWNSNRRYLGLAERTGDVRTIFPVETFDRLCEIKRRYDPTGMFRANHYVPHE